MNKNTRIDLQQYESERLAREDKRQQRAYNKSSVTKIQDVTATTPGLIDIGYIINADLEIENDRLHLMQQRIQNQYFPVTHQYSSIYPTSNFYHSSSGYEEIDQNYRTAPHPHLTANPTETYLNPIQYNDFNLLSDPYQQSNVTPDNLSERSGNGLEGKDLRSSFNKFNFCYVENSEDEQQDTSNRFIEKTFYGRPEQKLDFGKDSCQESPERGDDLPKGVRKNSFTRNSKDDFNSENSPFAQEKLPNRDSFVSDYTPPGADNFK
jgi:hypothetical protein